MMMENKKENKKIRNFTMIQQSVFFRILQTCPEIRKIKIVRCEGNLKE